MRRKDSHTTRIAASLIDGVERETDETSAFESAERDLLSVATAFQQLSKIRKGRLRPCYEFVKRENEAVVYGLKIRLA